MSNLFTDRTVAVGETAFLFGTDDARVPDGAHWRISIPPNAVPAGPVVVFPSFTGADDGGYVIGGMGSDGEFPPVEPGQPLYISVTNTNRDLMMAWAYVDADDGLRVAVIDPVAAPNGEYAEIAARTSQPYAFAVADLAMIKVTGTGRVSRVQVFSCPRDVSESLHDHLDAASLAHEVAEQIADYHQTGIGGEYWKDRVTRSAPKLALPYDPAEPNRPIDKNDQATVETNRIEALVSADNSVTSWALRAYAALRDPTAARLSGSDGDGPTITYDAFAALHTSSVDPGIARWLGLSGTIADLQPHDLADYQMLVAVVPVYRRTSILQFPPIPDAVAHLYDDVADNAYSNAVNLATGFTHGELLRWRVALLVVPLPVAIKTPPAPPLAPEPVAVRAAWKVDDPPQQQRWSQTVALDGAVPTGSVSLVATVPTWRTMHALTGGEPNRMIAGWPAKSQKAKRNPVVTAANLRASDDPADSDEQTLEVRLGDWVGRWSDVGTVEVAPPLRPAPPPPQLSATMVRAAAAPGGAAPATPGTITVVLRVPPTDAPGSYPTSTVSLDGGIRRDIALTADEGRSGATKRVSLAAPATVPGQQLTVDFTAWTVDATGTRCALPHPRAQVQVSDQRPVRGPTIAPRLLVTTRRTNDPTVSITLEIRPPQGVSPNAVAYRFLMAAETMLRAQLPALADPAWRSSPRALRAKQLRDAGGGDRRHYSWAIDKPVIVDGGAARVRIPLPSGTTDVVLLKALPMVGPTDSQGEMIESVSTPFTQIEPVAVVVPISDVPPIPRVRLTSPGPGRITATVVVAGVDPTILGRLDGPIQARIVEVIDPATSDPMYWPQLATLDLAEDGEEFTASVTITDLVGWTRVCLAAAVRYPPEPTALASAVVPQAELHATGVQPERIVSPWGPYSVPAWMQVAGPEPALAPVADPATVSATATGLLELPDGKPTWTVRFYSGTAALTPTVSVPVTAANPIATLGARDAATTYAAALVDPFGAARTPLPL